VALDLAWHGDSGSNRKDWTVEGYSGDVETVVKNLNLDSIILIGHSLGGVVMIEAARQIKVPLTCINSDMHPTEVDINRNCIPSFEVKIMTGVGHFPMVEAPETLNRLLDEGIGEISSE
jgi:pimeloyl-ACP methyl ester carboxylesterase